MNISVKQTFSLLIAVCAALAFVALLTPLAMAAKGGPNAGYATIQGGTIIGSDNIVIEVGYDQWGYNYQGRMFKGGYCDAYRDAGWCQAYKDDSLAMKWNDAWLSNIDRDNDGALDRHYGHDTYIGSGAWLTNHISGTYVDDNGKNQKWSEFYKIVTAPEDAYVDGGYWYGANDKEIGQVIWGSFAIILYVYNDTGTGDHGVLLKSPTRVGLGNW